MNFDFLTTALFSLVALWLFTINVLKMKQIRTGEVFSFLFIGTAIFVNILEYCFFANYLSHYEFIKYRSMSTLLLHATVLASFSLLSIQNLNPKKIKTIWRLPIIGALLGFFALKFHLHIQLGIGLVTVLLFLKSKVSLRVLTSTLIIHVACIVGFVFVGDYQFWLYSLIMIIYILNLKSIWDMLRLKLNFTTEDIE